jgi:hypothetical protein
MRIERTLIVALSLALVFLGTSAFMDPHATANPNLYPSLCIGGFKAAPAMWDTKAPGSQYTCTSDAPLCALGSTMEQNVAGMSGGVINTPSQFNLGFVGGKFIYKCMSNAKAPIGVPK